MGRVSALDSQVWIDKLRKKEMFRFEYKELPTEVNSIRSRKQLELKVMKELCEIYPISVIGIEDVSFNHYTKRWGKNFSQVEVGKKWLKRR